MASFILLFSNAQVSGTSRNGQLDRAFEAVCLLARSLSLHAISLAGLLSVNDGVVECVVVNVNTSTIGSV